LKPGANDRSTHERKASGEKTAYFIFLPEIFQDSEKTLSNTSNTSNASETRSGSGLNDSNPFDKKKNAMSNTSNTPTSEDDDPDYVTPNEI
jgi:hypothetical protein